MTEGNFNRSGTILQENEMVGNQRSTYPFMLFLQKGLQLADCQPYCSSAEKNWNRMHRDGADFSASFELQL